MDLRRSTETSASEQASLTLLEHAIRIGLVMAAAVALLASGLRHTEASLGDGLRYVRQAEEIERGAWREGMVGSIDHPLHPLAIVAAHRVVGDFGPVAWQRAAVALAFGCIVLLAVPSYLLSRELFGDRTAWLASSMVVTHRLCSVIVANALCESTFLLLWMWGLWAAVRFLREGRFVWLPVTIGFGVLAYLSRPEGMLLPLAMIASLGILPLHRATRINWPRWWRAVAFLSIGSLALAGPYVALKGSLGTRPGIARVLGLAPVSPPDAPEREQPLAADQSPLHTYRLATNRMLKVFRDGVSTPLLPLAVLGIVMMRRGPARARIWLFLGVILFASAVALVRLHATGGYCTVLHGLIPTVILTLAAAHGLSWVMQRISIPGRLLGLPERRLVPGPAFWLVVIAMLLLPPRLAQSSHPTVGPFSVYRDVGAWLAQNARDEGRILDLTDWSLYFSQREGYRFDQVYEAPADPRTRWVVIRKPHLSGHWNYSRVVRELVGNRDPVVMVPDHPLPSQLQVMIYDLLDASSRIATTASSASDQKGRR
ncbi:MAG: glycosyltransferase family 39 protein [Isosphaeraceae bacterium]